jgi:hypothetical protein
MQRNQFRNTEVNIKDSYEKEKDLLEPSQVTESPSPHKLDTFDQSGIKVPAYSDNKKSSSQYKTTINEPSINVSKLKPVYSN